MKRMSPFIFSSFLYLLFLYSYAFPSVPGNCLAQVVINELYYDHVGRDEGWEFVELYNTGTNACDLSDIRIDFVDGRTGRSRTVWSATDGLSLDPHRHLLIAGDSLFPPDGLRMEGSLENGPDAIRLASPQGVIDVVGYGALELVDLFETEPAPDVEPGWSLSRKPDGYDSDMNRIDFVSASPSPGGRNFFRYDLCVSVLEASFLPCKGFPVPLTVRITNTGLETYMGFGVIVASTITDATVCTVEEVPRYIELDPSDIDSLEILLSSPLLPSFEIYVFLRDYMDENPSNDTISVSVHSSPGPIVVNEVMYRPHIGGSEWLELKNTGSIPRNLRSWLLSDATCTRRLISHEDVWIEPGGFLILAQHPETFSVNEHDCGSPVTGIQGGWPSLNDKDSGSRADVIELYDEDGVMVERVAYRDMLGDERGRSLERFSETVCSSDPRGVWHRCAASSGSTPGMDNSVHTVVIPAGTAVTVSPNPFHPVRDRLAVISGSLREWESGFLVRIFDLSGIEVTRLFGEEGGARIFSCRWNGRSQGGSAIPPGLYVCLVEFVRMGGAVCRREKLCIVVAGAEDVP